jgi:GalNAc-alpha-(1->4)-GalNAc-alpha-(1->3)-diNAcBac-PP-undecaprenol alpha-1,4-N-acetyl-D-galactosaminyltransferase
MEDLKQTTIRDPEPACSIAIVIDGFGSGGAERVAATLLNAWAGEGRAATAITFRPGGEDFFEISDRVRRIAIGGTSESRSLLQGVVSNLARLTNLRRALRASGAQTTIGFITATNVLLILAAWGLPVRVVISERNDPQRQDPGRQWRILRRCLYPFADVVTANSDHALEQMRVYVPTRKLRKVPNPVAVPQQGADPVHSRTVLSIGRLVPQKNQRLLIEAFSRLGERGAAWRLEIVGEGPDQTALTAAARQSPAADRIAFLNNVADPAICYRGAAMFVLPSLYEGTPNTLLEAMAHGLPCVVADCQPGALEHVENGLTGLVFPAGDVEGLSGCLESLIHDPDLRLRLGTAARQRMQQLSLPQVLARWDAIFRDR